MLKMKSNYASIFILLVFSKCIASVPSNFLQLNSEESVDEIQLVYSCNFDKDLCNANLTTNGTYPLLSHTGAIIITSTLYRITDVSSISEKAENGKNCVIPFTYRDLEYFACTPSNECETSKGLSKCAPGKFIHARSSLYGEAFVAEISLETIQVSENGRYSLRYFFFTYCNNSECQSAVDFIQINVITRSSIEGEESSQQVDTSKLNLNEITLERRWLEREMTFDVNIAPATLKINFYVKRTYKIGQYLHVGLDSISLYKLKDTSSSPDSLTTTQKPTGATTRTTTSVASSSTASSQSVSTTTNTVTQNSTLSVSTTNPDSSSAATTTTPTAQVTTLATVTTSESPLEVRVSTIQITLYVLIGLVGLFVLVALVSNILLLAYFKKGLKALSPARPEKVKMKTLKKRTESDVASQSSENVEF